MDVHFVCLAKSYKYGGRCVAGVQMLWDDAKNNWKIVRDADGVPVWVRPICRQTENGEIPTQVADGIDILEVLKLENAVPVNEEKQPENFYYDKIAPAGKSYKPVPKLLEMFIDKSRPELFFNRGKAVTPEVLAESGGYSLVMVYSQYADVYSNTYADDEASRERYRIRFAYNNNVYDLPITDPEYLAALNDGTKTIGNKRDVYITCSLGIEHEGWYYKLAACIFETGEPVEIFPQSNVGDDRWFRSYESELAELLAEKKDIEQRIEALRFEIKNKMEENRNGKIQTENFTISFTPSKTVMQFDSKTFKAENAELYIKYSKPIQRPSSIVIKQLNVEN